MIFHAIFNTVSYIAIAKSNDLFTARHPGESRGPEVPRPVGLKSRLRRDWIPAFAGMTVSGCLQSDKSFGNG